MSHDDFLLEAQREVDAMLPDTAPIEPPKRLPPPAPRAQMSPDTMEKLGLGFFVALFIFLVSSLSWLMAQHVAMEDAARRAHAEQVRDVIDRASDRMRVHRAIEDVQRDLDRVDDKLDALRDDLARVRRR